MVSIKGHCEASLKQTKITVSLPVLSIKLLLCYFYCVSYKSWQERRNRYSVHAYSLPKTCQIKFLYGLLYCFLV